MFFTDGSCYNNPIIVLLMVVVTYRSSLQEGGVGLHFTLSRRLSRRSYNEPPPDYPGVAAGRSFDPTELSDDEEDDVFITAAPPAYSDIVAFPPP